jgi:hypothetical protein
MARRRELCTGRVFEIRGNSNKGYFRVFDKGSPQTMPAGTTLAIHGYRHIFKRVPERTCASFPRLGRQGWIYVDWHDRDGVDTITLPPDFIGRDFVVMEERNCALLSTTLTGRLLVAVDCLGSYASLRLHVF